MISIVFSNGKLVKKESMSKLHLKGLRSCLPVMDANSNESLTGFSFFAIGDIKPEEPHNEIFFQLQQ